jgi:polyhydroxyalkanoate synthesis regulator phasin
MTTGNETTENKPEETEKKTSLFYDLSRKVLLASVGAAVVAQDEISNYVEKLSERGEIAEKDARRLVKEVLERRDKMEREKHAEAERTHPNVVTRSDIENLQARIEELSKKLDELKSQSAADEKKA